MTLKAGLYIIATPIGNLGDITFRAVETLKTCDVIACEDTRTSRKLLNAYDISKPLISYHDHNGDQVRPQITAKISAGQAVALISDAGTPLISDPGYKLVRACYAANQMVTIVPGPSSVIAGLVLSGMPSDRFLFAGFADRKTFPELASLDLTLIFFESAQRLCASLTDMSRVFSNRGVAVVREITKLYEEARRGTFEELISFYEDKGAPKGEIVVVLSPPSDEKMTTQEDIDHLLIEALKSHTVRDACALVAGALNLPKKQVYQRALTLAALK